MRIILACAAGMSTSLLANNITKEAQERDMDVTVEALSTSALSEAHWRNADVVLVGPQMRYQARGDCRHRRAVSCAGGGDSAARLCDGECGPCPRTGANIGAEPGISQGRRAIEISSEVSGQLIRVRKLAKNGDSIRRSSCQELGCPPRLVPHSQDGGGGSGNVDTRACPHFSPTSLPASRCRYHRAIQSKK